MKKSLMAINVILAFLMITVSGCGDTNAGRSVSSSSGTSVVTLNFISSWGGNDPNANTIQQVLDRFCKDNPNVKVVNQSVFGDDFLPYLKTAFVSGEDPDVFGLWPGSDINSMIDANKVADLTDMIDSDRNFKDSFGSNMWQYVTYNNKIYGLPVEIVFEGLFVNRDLFEKYNVTIPTTFNELLTAVKIFKKNNITAIAYNSTAEGTYIYQNIAASIGGKSAIENPFSSGSINNCYIKAMYDMRTLYKLHAFPTNYLTMDSAERNSLFAEKKAAMIVQGSWYTGSVVSNPDADFVRFPNCGDKASGNSSIVYGFGNGVFHISQKAWENADKKKAAIKLLKYIASGQSAKLFAGNTGMLTNINIGNDMNYNRLTTKGLTLISKSKQLIGPPDSYISRHAWQNIIVNDFPYMFEGTKSPEEIWNEAMKGGAKEK